MFEFAILLIFPAAMCFAGAMDLVTMTIPNRISLVLVAAFAVVAPFVLTPLEILYHLAAGAAVLAVTFAMFARGWMGGGDAKLLACAALWIGFDHLTPYFLQVAIIGGFLALALLMFRKAWPQGAVINPAWLARLHQKTTGIPYGIAIAGAALVIYPSTAWLPRLAG